MPESGYAGDPPAEAPRATLSQLALLFLRLGLTAFGGPAAHVAIMEDEIVRRRRWLSSERFLDLLGTANLIPGPSSTELATFIGYEQAGWRGLLIAGACFILPAALMVTLIAWAYVRFGEVPQVGGVLYGIKPVVIAIVVQALWALGPKAVKRSWSLGSIALATCIASAFGIDALVVLVAAGVASVILGRLARSGGRVTLAVPAIAGFASGPAAIASAPLSLITLFLVFLKIGAVVFGSGYVLIAFLRADLVDRLHWLTESQLIDAVAVGQVTPGPVFTTATFIGYVVAGGWGAAVATVAIFVPGFLLVGAARPLVARVRRSPIAASFLDGVNVASLALMAVVTIQLAKSALVDLPTAVLAAVAAVLLLRFKVNATWLVFGGAVAGAVVRGLR
jgi:chromate transporter